MRLLRRRDKSPRNDRFLTYEGLEGIVPQETQAVTKMYDVVKWVIPVVGKLPRDYKFTLGDRIINQALDVLMLLVDASYARSKRDALTQASCGLEQLRYLLRLCLDLELWSVERYEFTAREVNEVGRMIGGWLKQQERKP